MSTIAFTDTTTALPARARIAAGLALPLGLMTLVGTVIFWDWSWTTWVGVWGGANGLAGLAGAVNILRNDERGARILRYAMVSGMIFTLMKLVFWQELEAATFGIVSAAIYALVRNVNR